MQVTGQANGTIYARFHIYRKNVTDGWGRMC